MNSAGYCLSPGDHGGSDHVHRPPDDFAHRSVDATGRALPMTEEEIRARAVAVARGLDALDDMGDEEEQRQTLDALVKAIDEEPLSARRRFRP